MGAVLACSFRRLHVTPFTAELEDKIIAPSLAPLVRELSFHSKPTFPDKGFGFIELPEMEAEKLKRKFHGATLRGQKVRVEDARERKVGDEEVGMDEGGGRKKSMRRDKKTREEGVVSGVEIEEGRVVKRGWSGEQKRSKRKASLTQPAESKVEGKKLRFKTTVPPNVAIADGGKGQTKGKGSKSDRNVVVEEFGKSKKALVTSGDEEATEHGELSYEDGKGWVDSTGNVVEAERTSKRPTRRTGAKNSEPTAGAIEITEVNTLAHDDGMAMDVEMGESSKAEAEAPAIPDHSAKPTQEVHPLEALFKRPTSSSSNPAKSRPKPIDTSFSFFDAGAADDQDAEMGVTVPPKTPNTRKDLEWRSIRSAAPTPDTAAIGRKFSFPFASGEDEEDDSEDDDAGNEDPAQAAPGASRASGQEQEEESAFRKWFYEHRGENNRGWKKRRREEKKQKRQRENRRLSRKVA